MSNEAQSSDMFSSEYHDLHMEPDFCDAVLQVQGVNFKVHKVILCKCSPYFGALFRRWSAPDKSLFEIPGLSPDMMQHILEFAYTGSVSVTETNVQELLLAADQLNVMGIVQTCYDFLGEHLCLRNCIGIWQFTNICCSSELRHKVSDFIVKHFEEIVSCEEFLQLSVEELTHILSRDDLNVRKESIVFDAINHWIAYIPEERERHMAALLSQVRLTSTDAEYIKHKVMSNKLVKSNPDCKTIASKALKDLRHSNALRSTVSGHINPFTRPRLPHAILLAMGGWSGGDPTNGIEAYDIRADNWINVTDQRERPRAYHGTAFLHGYVFCIGGFNRIEHFNSMRKFDPSTLTWHEAAPMHYRRCYVSVTVLDGCIYAMGGFDGTLRLNTAERYRPETNQWTIIAPMHEQRSDANCAALLNRVYICGGFNGNECLQTCEYYSPESNQWTMITPMSSRRSGIGVIAYADHVFAVGGFDGNNRLRSVEAYSPRTNTWQSVCSMLTPRSNFGIEVLEEQLFAVGGFNGFTTSYNVECYDALMDEWTEVTDMEIFRSALSCCVVSDIPNVDRFVLPRGALPELHVKEESVESGDSS